MFNYGIRYEYTALFHPPAPFTKQPAAAPGQNIPDPALMHQLRSRFHPGRILWLRP
jgi:hypothetical protein